MSIEAAKLMNLEDGQVLYNDLRDRMKEKADIFERSVQNAAIASFSDGADGLPLKAMKVGIEPVQDLHGYDYPWPAGATKNKWSANSSLSGTGNLLTKETIDTIPAGNYIFSCVKVTYTNYFSVIFFDSSENQVGGGTVSYGNSSVEITLSDDATKVTVYSPDAISIKNIQIESGSTVTDYIPYSNICPITGWTEAKVTRTGKNLADFDLPYTTASSDATNQFAKHFTLPKVGKYIRCSGKCSDNTVLADVAIVWLDSNNNQVWNIGTNFANQVPEKIKNVTKLRVYTPSTYAGKTVTEFQIEYVDSKNSVATEYEPFEGTTLDLTFPTKAGTVYGGTLDVVNGTLTVTSETRTIIGDASLSSAVNANGTTFIYGISKSRQLNNVDGILLDKYKLSTKEHANLELNECAITSSGDNQSWSWRFVAPSSANITSATELNQWLANNPIQITYSLTNPIVYQLTPAEVKTLLGQNNIWADTGNILDLSYLCNTGLAYESLSGNLEKIRQIVDERLMTGTVYGFHIDGSESDPDAAVTYLEDAIGKTPAHMDYAAGTFDYGSWKNAFFMPRPVMLKPDGTVDCYLDPNDHSRREDGTESHIAHLGDVEASTTAAKAHAEGGYFVIGNVLYRATAAIAIGDTITIGTNCEAITNVNAKSNAMVEWGRGGKKIWYKIVPDAGDDTSASVYIADYQVDGGYHCWSFINNAGNMVDHFYTPMYFGTIVNDGTNDVLRSLSGASGANRCKNKTAAQEVEMARRNGSSLWDIEVYADVILINLLLVLMGKSLDTQTVFGEGLHTSGTDAINDTFVSGQHDAQGAFFGTNSGAAATYYNASKVFFMENWWGFMWRRIQGLIANDRVTRHKLTRGTADGSSVSDYVVSTTASDYAGYNEGGTMPTASGTYVGQMQFNGSEFTPKTAGGTSMDASHYYCDGLWTNTGCRFASRGGHSDGGSRVGAFCLALNFTASDTHWTIGAAPSCKPLA